LGGAFLTLIDCELTCFASPEETRVILKIRSG
jgi:hypothetical protein